MKFEKVIAILKEEIDAWGVDYEHHSDESKEQIDAHVDELKQAQEVLEAAAGYENAEKAICILKNAASIDCLVCTGCTFEAPGRTCSACDGHGVVWIDDL